MLTRPWIVGPVSELTRAIRVQGQFAGATVTISSIGPSPRVLCKGQAGSSDVRLGLLPGEHLRKDDLLVAMQDYGGDASPQAVGGMIPAVPVQPGPSALGDLGYVNFVSNLWRCGRYLWLNGGIPGADCIVSVGGNKIGSGTFFEAEGARLTLASSLTNAAVTAQQVTALGSGPTTSRVPLALPGHMGDPLPAPAIDPLPLACQMALSVTGVIDGAEVVLTRSDGHTVTELRSGFDAPALWWPMSVLKDGEQLTIHQEVDKKCERNTFSTGQASVGPLGTVPIPTIGPLCAGTTVVVISDLIPAAQVELNINGAIVRGQTPPMQTSLTMIVDPLAAGTVSVRQLQCSTWSNWSVPAPIDTAPAKIPPFSIVEPLYSCSPVVILNGVHEGAIIQVVSKRFGPIGGPVVRGSGPDPFVVAVAPLLAGGDEITVTQWACGGAPTSVSAGVQGHPDTTRPTIQAPVYVGDVAVTVTDLLLGATVIVQVTDKSGSIVQAITVSGVSDGKQQFRLSSPLNQGDIVTARQSFCDSLSKPSDAVTVKLVPITSDWWTWDGSSPVVHDWNREYTVSGVFTNKGTTPIINTHFAYWENVASPGDFSPGLVAPGASTPGAFPLLKQNWSWLTPGVWNPHGPFAKTFTYRVDITGADQQNNNYPVTSSTPYTVIIEVSKGKRLAAATAASQAIAAVGLAAAAAAAAVGIITAPLAVPLGIAAGAAAAASAAAGAVALDPPEPDPAFRQRVALPAPQLPALGPAFPALAHLLLVMGRIPQLELAKSTMQGRVLGARAANEQSWVAVHLQDIHAATELQRDLAAKARNLIAPAIAELAPRAAAVAPHYASIRHRMLVSGVPRSVTQTAALPADQVAALDVLARSTLVGYPNGDCVVDLYEATNALCSFVDALAV